MAKPGKIKAIQKESAIAVVTVATAQATDDDAGGGLGDEGADGRAEQGNAEGAFAEAEGELDVGDAGKPVGNQHAVDKKDGGDCNAGCTGVDDLALGFFGRGLFE